MTLIANVLFIFSGLCLLIALHPFITYPLSLKVFNVIRRPGKSHMKVEPATGRFAICMCAYNEEHVIKAKMLNLLAMRQQEPDLEILVYVDAASDRTAELLAPFASQIKLHVSPVRHGKTHGMNLLVSQTTAPYIVFTDANVRLDIEGLQKLRNYFAHPSIGCVCGDLIYTNGDDSVTAATGSLYWRLEQAIKSLEQASGSVMGADGSLFAIRRELHQPPPDHIIDDMYVSFMILCQGYRVVQANDVRAYEESVSNGMEEFRRKIRIACQAFNVHRILWPAIRELNALTIYKYVSHKLLRWLSIYFLVLSACLFEIALLFAQWPLLALILPLVTALCFYIGLRWSAGPLTSVVEVIRSLGGAGIGVWQSVRGQRYQTWQPSASIRGQG
ncbi:MAG TPA: glycosyltransferase family 2 protein [Steroidobacteraceae bacterium]|nr:glycosyltransferase family 2 protein [Steroidobacteraceae bacterium]